MSDSYHETNGERQAQRVVENHSIEHGIEWFDVRRPDGSIDTDGQCARCGASVAFVRCWDCGGEGNQGSACIDDMCHGEEECIHGDSDLIACSICRGAGGSWHCLNDRGYCLDHPLAGREQIESSAFADSRSWDDA